MSRTESNLDEYISPGSTLATGEKQTTANDTLALIEGNTQALEGAGVAGQRVLTLADTWYSVPSTVPTSPYLLIISKETAVGTFRKSFASVSVPSTTYGNKMTETDLVIELGANAVIYIGSSSALDSVNWTTKII